MGDDGRGEVSEKSMCPGDGAGRPRGDTRPRQSQKNMAALAEAEEDAAMEIAADGGKLGG